MANCDPERFEIKIRRGIHYGPLVVTCQDANFDPVDLTGYSVFSVGRPQLESPNIVNLQPVLSNAAQGQITIELTNDQTKAFPAGDYVWDLVLEEPAGQRLPPLMGGPLLIIDYVSRIT